MTSTNGSPTFAGVTDERPHDWHPATRVAFRFCVVYLGLYVILTQTLGAFLPIPGLNPPDLGTIPPARPLFLWIGQHILGLTPPSPCCITATGDTLFGWMTTFSLVLIAAGATLAWSVVARGRTAHPQLFGWFRLFLRIALGTTFLYYGFAKVIPQQMPTLDLVRLVEPFGNFSPMGVLWSSIGASPAYEIATGCAEVLGGLLLFFPMTSLVGTIICLLDGTMVFLLNMTYDVNVKLLSLHLIVMSLVLLAPNARPLFDLLVRHRVGSLRSESAVGGSALVWRKLVIAQAVYCVYLFSTFLYGGVSAWRTQGVGAPHSPLFGIWEVDSMAVGGQTRAPLLSDTARWRRLIFQDPRMATVQRMDETFRRYIA